MFEYWTGWRSKLRPASFRGVEFHVEEAESSFGRRFRIREYVKSDKIFVQDLGAAPDEFELTGYIIQNADNDYDYFDQRDLLIRALKTKGPGQLVHPFLGELTVSVIERPTLTESFSEGGIARFTMRFAQSGDSEFPELTKDWVNEVDESVLDSINNSIDDFINLFITAGAFVENTARDIQAVLDTVQDAVAAIRTAGDIIISATNIVSSTITSALNTIDAVMDVPGDLANVIKEVGQAFTNLCGLGDDEVELRAADGTVTTLSGQDVPQVFGYSIVSAMVTAADVDEDELGNATQEQEENRRASIDLIKSVLLSNACRVAIRIDFTNQDDALAIMGMTKDALDEFLLQLGEQVGVDNVAMYTAVQAMRGQFVEAMYGKFATLTQKIQYTVPPAIQTTLQLAYERYNNLDRAQEVFDLNNRVTNHPGFLPEGDVIEILNE
jgi:prophage DNA circulation protein